MVSYLLVKIAHFYFNITFFKKMLFPENNKANFEEISKLFPGEYELKSRGTSQLIRGKQYFFL